MSDAMHEWLNRRRNTGGVQPVPTDPAAYRPYTLQAFPNLFPEEDEDALLPAGLYPRDSSGNIRSLALPSSLVQQRQRSEAEQAELDAAIAEETEGLSAGAAWMRQQREREAPGTGYRFMGTGGVPFIETVEGPVAASDLRGATLGLPPEVGQPFGVVELGEAGAGGFTPIVPIGSSAPGAAGEVRGPRSFGQAAGDAGMWTLRQVGSALEPLTLLQDVFFATVADIASTGADKRIRFEGNVVDDHEVDDLLARVRSGATRGVLTLPDGTVVNSFEAQEYLDGASGGMWQNLSQIEWANYAPGGVAPARPVTGAELLQTLGVENENAQRWGGIAMDLVADPLLLGAALRVAGRGLNALSRGVDAAGDASRALTPAEAARLGSWTDDGLTAAQRRVNTEADRLREGLRDLEREVGWESFSPDVRPTGGSVVPRPVSEVRPGIADATVVQQAGDAAAAAAAAGSRVGDPLIRLGNAVDNAMSIGGVARAAWFGDNAASTAVRSFVDSRLQYAWRAIQGSDGLLAVAGRRAADWLAPPRERAVLLMGDAGRPGAGVLEGSAARSFGEQTVLNRGLGDARGGAVSDASVRSLDELVADTLGLQPAGYFQRIFNALRGMPRTFRQVDDLPEAVRQSMLTQAFDVVDSGGLLVNQGARTGIRVLDDDVARVQAAVADGFEGADAISDAAARWTSQFDSARVAVRQAAESAGITDATRLTEIEDRFTRLVEGLTAIDSRLGFEASGYGLVRERFLKGFMDESGAELSDAVQAWEAVLIARLRDGTDLNDIENMRIAIGASGERTFVAGQSVVDDVGLLGPGATVADFLRTDTLFTHLDLNRFVDSLRDGHLRRAYGVWTDPNNLNALEGAYRGGRLVPNSLLADHVPQRALKDPEVLADFESYLTAVAGSRTNFIVRQDSMIQHLTERAVARNIPPAEAARLAQGAWNDVVKELNPHMGEWLDRLHARTVTYRQRAAASQTGTQGFAAFQPRKEIEDEWLELLGELRDPLTSILESSQAARRIIPIQDFMRNTYEAAISSGHVVRKAAGGPRHVDANGVRYTMIPHTARHVFGGFASQKGVDVWVHPQLVRELEGVFKTGSPTFATYNRIRSAIAGGYLASPNMAFVNLAGAVFSSTIGLDGANPIPLLRNMGAVAREVFSGDSPWLRRLNDFIPAGDLTQAHTTVLQRNLASLRLESAGTGGMGVGAAVRHAADWYEGVLQAPGGLRLAGLEGFQLIDQWVRTAAFKTHYERLRAGGRSGLVADALDDSRALAEAAELARLSALDYASLPKTLEVLRDTGLMMFPGFPFLMVQRNISAALNRPAGLAVYDRVQDAITNAVVDPEERATLFAGMDEWLREAGGAPISQYVDENGDIQWMAIPIADIIPTRTRLGGPMVEGLANLGLWGPLFDVAQAIIGGSGEAMLAGQFGQRVFEPHQGVAGRVGDVGAFLYNSFAPAFARRLYSPGTGSSMDRGLVPQAARSAQQALGVELEPGLRDSLYSLNELERRRADRGFVGELIATFLRSPQTLSSSGPLASIQRTYGAAEREFNMYRAGITEEVRRAAAAGDHVAVRAYQDEFAQRAKEFRERWNPVLTILREANERGRQRRIRRDQLERSE